MRRSSGCFYRDQIESVVGFCPLGLVDLLKSCSGVLCLMDSGGDPPLPLPPDIDAFKRLIVVCRKRKGGPS